MSRPVMCHHYTLLFYHSSDRRDGNEAVMIERVGCEPTCTTLYPGSDPALKSCWDRLEFLRVVVRDDRSCGS